MKFKIIAIVGESGSGKDTILKGLLEKNPNLNKIIFHTTRPPRDYEVNGKDYHFISHKNVKNYNFIQETYFNHWLYGIEEKSLATDKVNIGIFSPEALLDLKNNEDINLYIFWSRTPDKIRIIRQLNREKNPDIKEIFRRWTTDTEAFKIMESFCYEEVRNENEKDLASIISIITPLIQYLESKIGQ